MKFDIGTILSISHSKLLTEIGNFYKILNYMLDDNLFTHQLPRAKRFAKSFVLAQYPQLEQWELEDAQITTDNWKEYLEKAKKMFGEELEIDKVPGGAWTLKDPVEELEEMVPKEKILKVEANDPFENRKN